MYTGSPELLKQLKGRRILIGVSGGIAAYKVASVVSTLAQAGVEVDVAMTEAACEFVTPLTFQALSGKPVYTSVWDQHEQSDPQHIRLAGELDAALVAPCTMNMLGKLAGGRTDDAVSLLLSAINRAHTPVFLAPSMNDAMWNQPATQRNLATLESDGYHMIAPGEGWQACRTVGTGRLPEPDELVEVLGQSLS